MDGLRLIQKQGFTRNEFYLTDETISVKQFTIAEQKEWVTGLDYIGHKKVIEKDTSFTRIWLSLFMGLSAFFWVGINTYDHSHHMATWIWMAFTIICLWFAVTIYITPVNNKLCLVSGKRELILLTDKPSEKEVQEFVEEIIQRSKKVLLRKYCPDPDLPEDLTISNLKWLQAIEVIDDVAFNELMASYNLHRSRSGLTNQ